MTTEYSVPERYQSLYESLLEAVVRNSRAFEDPSGPALAIEDKDGKLVSLYDSHLFFRWVYGFPGSDKDVGKKEFKEWSCAQCGIKESKWNDLREIGFPDTQIAHRIFVRSAQLRGLSVLEGLYSYLRYAEAKGAKLFGLKNHQDILPSFLAKMGGSRALRSEKDAKFDPFSDRIGRLIESAEYQRNELETAIANFALDPKKDRGFVVVTGDAGTGKSAILANATRYLKEIDTDCVYHFNSVVNGRNRTGDLVGSLFEQLSLRFDLSCFRDQYEKFRRDGEFDDGFVSEVLTYLSQTQLDDVRLIVIVDALDEVWSEQPSSVSVTNIQTIPQELPAGVFFVVSARKMDTQVFKDETLKIDLSDVSKEDSFQRQDVEGYIRQKLDDPEIKDWLEKQSKWQGDWEDKANQFVKYMCARSRYIFVYLHHIFINIDRYSAETLPDGLSGYYHTEYKRLLSSGGQNIITKKLMIAAVCNFKPDVSFDVIAAYCGHQDIYVVDDVINDWFDLHLLHRSEVQGHLFVSFFHVSFYEFLTDKEKSHPAREISVHRSSQPAFCNVSRLLFDCLDVSSEVLCYKKPLEKKFKQELFRTILYALSECHDMNTAARLLVHKEFCRHLIAIYPDDGPRRIWIALESTYRDYLECSKNDNARELLGGFLSAIAPANEAIINREYITHKAAITAGAFSNGLHEQMLKGIGIEKLNVGDPEGAVDFHASIKALRRTGEMDRALDILEKKFPESDKSISALKIAADQKAKIIYEWGYIEYLQGHYADARDKFSKSSEYSAQDGDVVGEYFSDYLALLSGIFSGAEESDNGFRKISKLLVELEEKCSTLDRPDFCRDIVINIRMNLFGVAVEQGKVSEAAALLEDHNNTRSIILEIETNSSTKPWRLKQRASMKARLLYLKTAYKEALKEYAKFLEYDLSDWRDGEKPIELGEIPNEGGAVDFLYAGRCAKELGKEDLAHKIFSNGLALDRFNGNVRYHDFIQKEIDDGE